jgi:hypothetical protein
MAHRKWTDERIAATLDAVVADLGRMPTRTELAERDLAALWSAMRRNGGTRLWAQRASGGPGPATARRATPADRAAPPDHATPPDRATAPDRAAPPPEERIRVRAYFLAMEGAPGGPEAHWLRAERELAA